LTRWFPQLSNDPDKRKQEITYGLGWGGQFLVVVPGLKMVLAINQSREDENAIRHAGRFVEATFPHFFDAVSKGQPLWPTPT